MDSHGERRGWDGMVRTAPPCFVFADLMSLANLDSRWKDGRAREVDALLMGGITLGAMPW